MNIDIPEQVELTPAQKALSPQMIVKSLVVALVVGTVLCLINQGDALLAGREINIWKVVLTFIVPFLVSTYGAWNMAQASMSAANPQAGQQQKMMMYMS